MKKSKSKYSDNLDFFMGHQVFVSTSNNQMSSKICSRLESRVLGTVQLHHLEHESAKDAAILSKCKEIHEKLILEGETISLEA